MSTSVRQNASPVMRPGGCADAPLERAQAAKAATARYLNQPQPDVHVVGTTTCAFMGNVVEERRGARGYSYKNLHHLMYGQLAMHTHRNHTSQPMTTLLREWRKCLK